MALDHKTIFDAPSYIGDIALTQIQPPPLCLSIDHYPFYLGLQGKPNSRGAFSSAYTLQRPAKASPAPQLHSRLSQKGSPISRLPHELILHIVTYLPVNSKVALALVCRSLYDILRTPLLKSITQGDIYPFTEYEKVTARLEILKVLQQDVPHLRLCHYCCTLHKWPHSAQRSHLTNDPACCGPCRPSSVFPCDYQISFSDIQMAMDRYLYGPKHGLPLSAFALSTHWQSDLSPNRTRVFFFYGRKRLCARKLDISPHIISGRLNLHMRQHLWYPTSQKHSLRSKGIEFNDLSPCVHYCGDRVSSNDLNRIVNCRLMRRGVRRLFSCRTCNQGYRCPLCKTEFVVTVHEHGDCGVELVLDAWQDLGSGRSLDEFGPRHPWSPQYDGWPTAGIPERVPEMAQGIARRVFRTDVGVSAMEHPSMEAILSKWRYPARDQGIKVRLENARRIARWVPGISRILRPRSIEPARVKHP